MSLILSKLARYLDFSCQTNQKIVTGSNFSFSEEADSRRTFVESVTGRVNTVDKT